MEDLQITENTTLSKPDDDGYINICIEVDGICFESYVSFEELEKWVASIKGQIIKSSNEQAKRCKYDKNCARQESSGCSPDCDDYPPVG